MTGPSELNTFQRLLTPAIIDIIMAVINSYKINSIIKNYLWTAFLILLIFFRLRLRLHSLIIRIIRSVLRSEDTAFSVKSTQRRGSPKGGMCSAKSLIKPRLHKPHANPGATEAVKSAVPIYA
jgi:hypothetical protein